MKRDMENKDWINDYDALKKVSKANPFTVPAGYFDDLSARIASLKNITTVNENGAGFTLPQDYFDKLSANIQSGIAVDDAVNGADTGFTVPEGYFDEMAANIQSRINVEEALLGSGPGFSVPEGYFEVLSSNIQSRINMEEALAGTEEGFTIPEGYFEVLSSNIQNRITVEESFTGAEHGFTVPEGYFEQLNQSILAKTVDAEQEAKVVSINRNRGIVRKLFRSTAFKYVTAACFAVAIGGGILLFQSPGADSSHKNSFLHKQLSDVPVNDIKSYLDLNVDAGDTQQAVTSEGTTVDDADLKNALKNYADSVQ